jgi:hypothetical protein
MAMGVHQQFRAEVIFLDKTFEHICFSAVVAPRVNHHAASGIVVDDISVFLKRVEGEGFNAEHLAIFCKGRESLFLFVFSGSRGKFDFIGKHSQSKNLIFTSSPDE